MPYRLECYGTASTPYILIDEANQYLKLQGESGHGTVDDRSPLREVDDWLKAYLATDFTSLTFDCALTNLNEAVARLLLRWLMQMDERAAHGKKVAVNWIATGADDRMVECGENFQDELASLTFHLIV